MKVPSNVCRVFSALEVLISYFCERRYSLPSFQEESFCFWSRVQSTTKATILSLSSPQSLPFSPSPFSSLPHLWTPSLLFPFNHSTPFIYFFDLSFLSSPADLSPFRFPFQCHLFFLFTEHFPPSITFISPSSLSDHSALQRREQGSAKGTEKTSKEVQMPVHL